MIKQEFQAERSLMLQIPKDIAKKRHFKYGDKYEKEYTLHEYAYSPMLYGGDGKSNDEQMWWVLEPY